MRQNANVRVLRKQPFAVVGPDARLRSHLAAENCCSRWIACGGCTVGIGEDNAAFGQAIHIRRQCLWVASEKTDPVIEVVDGYEQDIGAPRLIVRVGMRNCDNCGGQADDGQELLVHVIYNPLVCWHLALFAESKS